MNSRCPWIVLTSFTGYWFITNCRSHLNRLLSVNAKFNETLSSKSFFFCHGMFKHYESYYSQDTVCLSWTNINLATLRCYQGSSFLVFGNNFGWIRHRNSHHCFQKGWKGMEMVRNFKFFLKLKKKIFSLKYFCFYKDNI